MNSDLGTVRPMLPGTAQTGSTASTSRPHGDAGIKPNTNDVRGADKPGMTEKIEDDDEQVDTMVSGLNQLVQDLQRELQFSVDRDSGDTVIKVIDSGTDEVLRQIPSEELMQLRRRLEESAGFIIQDEA